MPEPFFWVLIKKLKKFRIEFGDTIIATIADSNGTSKSAKARVSGYYESPSTSIDPYMVLLRREDLGILYQNNSDITGYYFFVGESLNDALQLKTTLKEQFKDRPFEILSYKELQPEIDRLIELRKQYQVIFYLILMSGFSLTVLHAVLMSILERLREFGIMRAMGTSSSTELFDSFISRTKL